MVSGKTYILLHLHRVLHGNPGKIICGAGCEIWGVFSSKMHFGSMRALIRVARAIEEATV
jgi:hypothetical protein